MEKKVFETKSGPIAYWIDAPRDYDKAAAPTLVFLPGLTADHRLFDRQLAAFRQKYCCLVWDAPGHNESRPFDLDFSLLDWAVWLHGILEREGIGRPVLVGQSMGGYLSQMYLDEYPGHAIGFVCVDSAPLQRSYYTGWELFLLKHTKLMYLMFPWKTLISLGAKGTSESRYGRDLMRRMMLSYEKRPYCELTARGYAALAQAVESGRAFEITCPALLLCGEKDAAGSAKRYNVAWEKRTGIPLVWLEGAGHNSNTDVPDRVNALIDEFVQSLG